MSKTNINFKSNTEKNRIICCSKRSKEPESNNTQTKVIEKRGSYKKEPIK